MWSTSKQVSFIFFTLSSLRYGCFVLHNEIELKTLGDKSSATNIRHLIDLLPNRDTMHLKLPVPRVQSPIMETHKFWTRFASPYHAEISVN